LHNIGLIGKARSGKDTAALHLVATRAYTRLAFADPLKEMALQLDPLVPTGIDSHGRIHTRLSALIRDVGWEYAKDHYQEVRRILQTTGQTVREYDDAFWITSMRRKLNAAESWNLPVVVTDVRYPNEAEMLRSRGFRLVRIVRPGAGAGSDAAKHDSETALDDYVTDVTISNVGSVADLHASIAAL
jgi:hypothetical protein